MITIASTLLRVGLSPSSHRNLRCSFPLIAQVWRNDNDFTCSDIPPNRTSCQLNPGRDTTSNPVSVVLGLRCKRNHPIFSPSCPFGASSLVHFRSTHPVSTAKVNAFAFNLIAHHHIVSFAAA